LKAVIEQQKGRKNPMPNHDETVPATQRFIVPVDTVRIAATATRLVARDLFAVKTTADVSAGILYLGDDLEKWMRDKTEEPFAGSTLKYGWLSRYSADSTIISALGGEEKAEVTLTELVSLIDAQKNGEEGPLEKRHSNIFYIRDANSLLRAVSADWEGEHNRWRLEAWPVTDSDGWHGADQIFSRSA
jgi:hypothetical protein